MYSTQTKSKFGCVGAGQMGTGIAVVAAMNAKMDVLLMDANKDSIQRSREFVGMCEFRVAIFVQFSFYT